MVEPNRFGRFELEDGLEKRIPLGELPGGILIYRY